MNTGTEAPVETVLKNLQKMGFMKSAVIERTKQKSLSVVTILMEEQQPLSQ
jgi:hypothetical protein